MDEQHNPWTIIDEKEVYTNNWINVTAYNVLNPSGNKGVYGKVHFKNRAIGILPLDEDMNIYLVGQFRFPLNAYSWEIPEGGGPLADDPLLSAKRELKEETGLVAGQWNEILSMHLSNSVCDEVAIIYLARQLVQEAATPDEAEELVVKKVSFSEAYEMVENGSITDAIAVAAILKVKILMLTGKLNTL